MIKRSTPPPDAFASLVRPYTVQRDDDPAGKHRRSGPVVTDRPDAVQVPKHAERVTSTDLDRAYQVALDLNADSGEVQAAFEVIADRSITGEP
jgi:hypothetical protein